MRTGLILEGGAMRGLFTAGVLDVFMENNIKFDGAIGVSAGAVFGCNYKSHQIGRAIRYNKKYCRDKRYVSFMAWLKTGDLYPVEFCYKTLPWELDLFDQKAYQENPMDFYVTVTDAISGKPHYVKCNNGDESDIEWMRASASMPVFANVVKIQGDKRIRNGEADSAGEYDSSLSGEYSDGGTSDSIPLKYFESIGYDRNVVITTQPKEYRKKKYKGLPVIKLLLKKHPNLYKAMENRHIMYNETVDYINKQEEDGKIYVIRPTVKLKVKPAEKNPEMLELAYQDGRTQGEKYIKDVVEFLKGAE